MCVRRSLGLVLLFVIPLILPSWLHARPSWFRHANEDFPRSLYVLGLGIGTVEAKDERMRVAEENARSDLVRSIRTQITSEFIHETVETTERFDQYARSRVTSTACLEVDGIEIVRRESRGNTAYALAVLPKSEARHRHGRKIAWLSDQMAQILDEARRHEEVHQTADALKAYLRLYPLLARREEAQAVMLALADLSSAGQELDRTGAGGVLSRTEVDAAIERLTAKDFHSVTDGAAALAFRLGQQIPSGRCVLVLPFTYGETRFTSRFSRYLAQVVSHKLADAGLRPVRAGTGYRPQSTDHHREQARQAGANVTVSGPYVKQRSSIVVFAQATEVQSGKTLAAADVEVALSLVEHEGLDFLPQNFARALQDAGVFGVDELVGGELQVEAWTDRGAENVVLEQGEEVTLGVRVNRPCHLQVVYHLADGKRALLYENYYVNDAKVNHAVVLPDTFVAAPPFGVEVLQVFASTEDFPEVRVRNWKGYDVLEEDLKGYVSRTRGLRKKARAVREMAEARVTITTVRRL